MARAEALAGLPVEELVEQHQLLPVRIRREAQVFAVAGPPPVALGSEDRRQTPRELATSDSRIIFPLPTGQSTFSL